MMTNFLERRGPLISGIAGIVITLPLAYFVELESVMVPILASAMTFGIVLAGFSATQRNMLFTMRNSQVIKRLKKIDHMETVLRYLSRTSYIGITIVLFSFVGFFITEYTDVARVSIALLGGLVFGSIGYLVRNERVMELVLKRFMEE